MKRQALLSAIVGVVILVLAIRFIGASRADLMRSCLAAWLVVTAVPLGALPILMASDLSASADVAEGQALRLLLAGLPCAAVAGVVGFATIALASQADLAALYGWQTHKLAGIAARWFTPAWFATRSIAYLVLWTVLAFAFLRPVARPSPGRRRLAGVGLAVHAVIGTLAAFDWTLSLDLGPNASAFGLLLISLQVAFAATVAVLVTLAGGRVVPRVLVLVLLVSLAAAVFMQFVQYLVVWSANLPREIVWYQHRLSGLGASLFVIAPPVLVLAVLVLLPVAGRPRWPRAAAIGLLLLLEIADLLWLVTPSWRGAFSISATDFACLCGVAATFGGGALLVGGGAMREAWHG